MTTQRGFSLIELVIVIVLVSIAAVPLIAPLPLAGRAFLTAEELQTGGNVVEACADYILAARRNVAVGYTGITATICDTLPAPLNGFAPPQVTITDPFINAACPGTCKRVVVSATYGGQPRGTLTLMLVDY